MKLIDIIQKFILARFISLSTPIQKIKKNKNIFAHDKLHNFPVG